MRYLRLALVPLVFVACTDQEPAAPVDGPLFDVITPLSSHTGGAIVLNPGAGKPDGFCFFGPFSADQLSAVRTPSGTAQLSCNFSGLPSPGQRTLRFTDFNCFLNLGGISVTTESVFLATPSGEGQMTCQFNQVLAADAFTDVVSFPIALQVFVPCALGGAGEVVALSGNLHTVFHVTQDPTGGFHLSTLASPQGITGIGLSSGDTYQGTGGTHQHTNFLNLPFTDTFVNNFRIIGEGPGNNFLVHQNVHVTINANGELTAFVDNSSIECK